MDVTIIGAGAVGLNIAYYLRKGGADVTVLDRGFGDGCSFGNMGLLVPSHLIPLAAPGAILQGLKWMFNPASPFYIKPRISPDLIRWLWAFRTYCTEEHVKRSVPLLRDLQIASRDLTADLSRELDCEYEQAGLMMLYHDEGEQECLELERTARDAGMDAALVSEFDFETTARGGLLIREDAQLHPGKYMEALHERLVRMGVNINTDTDVTSVRDIPYKQLVLAAGSWTPILAKQLGIRVPIQPGKGYSLTFPKPDNAPPLPLLLCEARVAVTPFCDQIRYGGTMELSGWNRNISHRRVEAIRKSIPRYLPGLEVPEGGVPWAGLRPCTPDGLPILDRVENVTIAAGHAMQGIAMASITGKLTAEMLLDQPPTLDRAPLSLARFSKGAQESCVEPA